MHPFESHIFRKETPMVYALPGFMGHAIDYALLQPGIDFGLTALSWPGHNETEIQIPSREFVTHRLVHQLAVQLPDEPVILMGYSMGGRLALQYSLAFPENVLGLILVGSHAGLRTSAERVSRRKWEFEQLRTLNENGKTEFLDQWEKLPIISTQIRIPSIHRKKMRKARNGLHPETIRSAMIAFGSGTMPAIWEQLHLLDVPICLLCGEEDEKYRELHEEMSMLFPSAENHLVVDAGHCAHLENPDACNPILNRFVRVVSTGLEEEPDWEY